MSKTIPLPRARQPAADPQAEAIIAALGGATVVARMCNVRQPSVSLWRHRGIPLARWLFLHQLRPDVVPAPTVDTNGVHADAARNHLGVAAKVA